MDKQSSHPSESVSDARRVAPFLGAIIVAGAGIIFAVHAHNSSQAAAAQRKALTEQNQQLTAQLSTTQSQLAGLAAKVSELASGNSAAPAPQPSVAKPLSRRAAAGHRPGAYDPRFNKLQSQLDAQGKEIDAERSDIDSTRSDLSSTRTELTGSIAKTHDELVVLEKKGERSYFEFDITRNGGLLTRASDFKREGPVSISLKKADPRHGFADLALIVDDRNLSQKHVNLYQPAMFYEPDNMQPVEIVINDISKNHIHGYVSAPKYRKSELAAMSNTGDGSAPGQAQAANSSVGDDDMIGAPQPDQAANSNDQPASRQKLPPPSDQPSQQ